MPSTEHIRVSGSRLPSVLTATTCGPSSYSKACGQKRPDAVVIYSKLGWAHALNGNDRLALSFYNQALALEAFDVFSLFDLASTTSWWGIDGGPGSTLIGQ